MSITMSAETAHRAEATVKTTAPMTKTSRRPMRSAQAPAESTTVANARV